MKDSSEAYSRTRADHAMETVEDYVEEIARLIKEKGYCRVVDLSDCFGVTHVSVIQILQRLKTKGLIETEPYRPIKLTELGKQMAVRCSDRHDTVRQFLIKLGVGEASANLDSEGIEHHLSQETLDRMRDFLQN